MKRLLILGVALSCLSACACYPNCGDGGGGDQADNVALISVGLSMMQPAYQPAYAPSYAAAPYQPAYTRTVCIPTQWGAHCTTQ